MAALDDGLEVNGNSVSRGSSRVVLRMRSRVACRGCNQRKVRCDVTRTGVPCSNCLSEAAACEILPRKKYKSRGGRTAKLPGQSTAQLRNVHVNNHPLPYTAATAISSGLDIPVADEDVHTPEVDRNTTNDYRSTKYSARQLSRALSGPSPKVVVASEGVGNDALASLHDSEDILPDDSSLSYIGDKRGARHFVYDLCHPGSPQDSTPCIVQREPNVSWKPHELEYLRYEGAFNTLPSDVCDDLIRCYFHHVHFFLPVIDAAPFLDEYTKNGRQNISLVLFWSMLLAAANFVEPDVLRRAGFTSRKAMKTAFYSRAKALYDLDHGTDKLILIQSVILMGFWYTDAQDHTGAWYWIGIAITLSQTLGLHRCPQLSNRNQRFSEGRQSLARRIWWSCLVRDHWLSLAKGRPMRIHHEDHDIAMPGLECILDDLGAITVQAKKRFIPFNWEILANMWLDLVKGSVILGGILRVHYRANGPKPVGKDIEKCAEELQLFRTSSVPVDNTSDILRLHAYQLELFYEAIVAVLYRPYVLSGPSALPAESKELWQRLALGRARAAASNTNNILEKIIELNSVHLLKPMIITSLIPAMQINLFDCKSELPLRRGLGRNKLSLCMLVVSQLRETYWSASVIYRLFDRAQTILNGSHSNISHQAGKVAANNNNNGPHHTESLRSDRNSFNPSSQDTSPSPHLQQDYNYQQRQQQQERDGGPASLMPESNFSMSEQQSSSWPNSSMFFENVDQLLSPSFVISDNSYQSFFIDCDENLGTYEQVMPISSEPFEELIYNL